MVHVAVSTRPHEVIEDVQFGDGPGYTFTAGPPADLLSAYLLEDDTEISLALIRAKVAWVRNGFEEDDWAEIQDRLDDPSDPLATSHVVQMFEALLEEVTNRPPTSRSASSGTRARSTGGAKRKPKDETSGA